MVPKSQEWWQGIWNINFFRQSLKITSDILRYIRYSALKCHLAAAFCFIINVAWFIFSDLSSDAWAFSCVYTKRYIIYGQNSQSQEFQQNNLLKSCIGSLVESENCNRTASPPDLAHCAPPHTGQVGATTTCSQNKHVGEFLYFKLPKVPVQVKSRPIKDVTKYVLNTDVQFTN